MTKKKTQWDKNNTSQKSYVINLVTKGKIYIN